MMNDTNTGKPRKIVACCEWDSPLTAELIFGQRQTPSKPLPWNDGALFLLNMPGEGNAQALMFGDGKGEPIRISPPGFNLRSKVHEYGGQPYCAGVNEIFYCNFNDQEIYRQVLHPETGEFSPPRRLTDSAAGQVRYGDLLRDPYRNRLICVREDHRGSAGNPAAVANALVAIALDEDGAPQQADRQTVLFDGSDFVAGPSLSGDGEWLAFASWSHPDMPWDATTIRCARLNSRGGIEDCFATDSAEPASQLQPRFDREGNLYFLSDRSNFWNLLRVDAEKLMAGCAGEAVYPAPADCCGPPWELGNRNYAIGENGAIYLTLVDRCRWRLLAIKNGQARELEADKGLLEHLGTDSSGRLCYALAGDDDYPSIRLWDTHSIQFQDSDSAHPGDTHPGDTHSIERLQDTHSISATRRIVYHSAVPQALDAELVSRPGHFEFRTQGGASAYGLLYQPRNPDFQAPAVELPPLLVNVHGGPTGTARAALNPLHQFWTSRGFAVLDINHRGSTGYGREFRRALEEQWGVADIADVIAAVEYLIATEQVDRNRLAIRGGSAGGYVVLASLAACKLFSAGVSYYGVADLEMLARDTHKFESRYLDRLIGPYPETEERYRQRSPINRLDDVSAPVLILQGTEDKVVPPSQAELLYGELRNRIEGVEYISFPGEGHGFRQPANQIRALEAELDFYRRNLLTSTS